MRKPPSEAPPVSASVACSSGRVPGSAMSGLGDFAGGLGSLQLAVGVPCPGRGSGCGGGDGGGESCTLAEGIGADAGMTLQMGNVADGTSLRSSEAWMSRACGGLVPLRPRARVRGISRLAASEAFGKVTGRRIVGSLGRPCGSIGGGEGIGVGVEWDVIFGRKAAIVSAWTGGR